MSWIWVTGLILECLLSLLLAKKSSVLYFEQKSFLFSDLVLSRVDPVSDSTLYWNVPSKNQRWWWPHPCVVGKGGKSLRTWLLLFSLQPTVFPPISVRDTQDEVPMTRKPALFLDLQRAFRSWWMISSQPVFSSGVIVKTPPDPHRSPTSGCFTGPSYRPLFEFISKSGFSNITSAHCFFAQPTSWAWCQRQGAEYEWVQKML